MSIAFQQILSAQFAGAPPLASASFTPNAAGDTILTFGYTSDGINENILITGASTYAQELNYNTGGAQTLSISASVSCAAGAQTATANDSSAGFIVVSGALEYSGVSSIGSGGTPASNAAPGTGAGAILGTSVTVPSGSVLIAWCADVSAGAETITSTAGTSRLSNSGAISTNIAEYVGTGAAIQPAFTAGANGGNTYVVMQVMLVGSAAAAVKARMGLMGVGA